MSMHQYITAIKNNLPRARSRPLIPFCATESCGLHRLIAFTEDRMTFLKKNNGKVKINAKQPKIKCNTLLLHIHSSDRKKINWSFQAFEGTLVLGCRKCQPDEDTFHWVFQLENYISFPLGFYVHVSCISKSRNEWVCVHTFELSLIFCPMLHCIKCSVGFEANSALRLLQSSPVYYHHLWNSKQLCESSIHLHTFPIPCRLHHSSPPSVTAFVPPAAQSRAPAAKGWRVECRAAGKGWCVKPCCWRQRLCDSTSMKAVMDVRLEAGPD